MAGSPKKRAKRAAAKADVPTTPAEDATEPTLEREDQLEQVVALLLRGVDDRGVARHARDAGWPLDQVDALIDDARAEIRSATGATGDELVREALARRMAVYRSAMRAGNHNAALAALKDHDTLLGMYRYDRRTGQAEPPRPAPSWIAGGPGQHPDERG